MTVRNRSTAVRATVTRTSRFAFRRSPRRRTRFVFIDRTNNHERKSSSEYQVKNGAQSHVRSILLRGCETRTSTVLDKKKLVATERIARNRGEEGVAIYHQVEKRKTYVGRLTRHDPFVTNATEGRNQWPRRKTEEDIHRRDD